MLSSLPSLQEFVMMVPGVLMGLTFHEFAHAWVADRFGDDTPRLNGRVTLSPLAHLDILGTILLFVAGFGWAKPVPVNVSRLRPRIWGDVAVSLAGVTMNFLLAILFLILAGLAATGHLFGLQNDVLINTLVYAFNINLVLVAFNLIPLPPLDGFRVVRYLFPQGAEGLVNTLYQFGPFILMVLLLTNVADAFLRPVLGGLSSAVFGIVDLLFRVVGLGGL